MRSYQESVVNQIKQMREDNHQLIWLKNRNAKNEMTNKALQNNIGILNEKLRKTMEENRIVRQRTKIQHEENKEAVMLSNADDFYTLVVRLLLMCFNCLLFVIF